MKTRFVIAITASVFISSYVNAAAPSSNGASTQASDFTDFRVRNVVNGRFNALLQGWAVGNENKTENDQNLRLRRAELKLSGSIANAPKYFFMIDPARLIPPPNGQPVATENLFQDFGMSYSFNPGFEMTAGQFKSPTTAEGLDSSSELPLPERSLVGRTAGDRREMGVKLGYKTAFWNATSMLSSGRPIYTRGSGMFHDLDTRFELTPSKTASFGAFMVAGDDFSYSRKGRWGVNARYVLSKLFLRAEFAHTKNGPTHSQGYTAESGYWITENLQSVFRFETFSPGGRFGRVAAEEETLGLNYFLRAYSSKIQIAGSTLNNMAAINGTPIATRGAKNKEVTLALQTTL